LSDVIKKLKKLERDPIKKLKKLERERETVGREKTNVVVDDMWIRRVSVHVSTLSRP